jgi:hypothetical protein
MIEISKDDAVKLGLAGVLKVGEDLGISEFEKTKVPRLEKSFIDIENLGVLKKSNPQVIIRNKISSDINQKSNFEIYQTWRTAIASSHYYTKFTSKSELVGNLCDIDFSKEYYSYKNNNFFKSFYLDKIQYATNDFPYVRLRYDVISSNTTQLDIYTASGEETLRPKSINSPSKDDQRKNYVRWHESMTNFSSGVRVKLGFNSGSKFSGYHIPYPNTLSIYDNGVFNFATKIAPKFNEYNHQSVNGIIIVSTGTPEYKQICYVSPHTMISGFTNTIEDLSIEETSFVQQKTSAARNLATVNGGSWYSTASGSGYLACGQTGWLQNINGAYNKLTIGSQNSEYSRFYKVGDPRKQIFFDQNINSPYGSGRWCICVSGDINLSINTGQRAIVYMHNPINKKDWEQKDPRKLQGKWIVASGHKYAFSGQFIRAVSSVPAVSKYSLCRTTKIIKPFEMQTKSLLINSLYLDSGKVLPSGINMQQYAWTAPEYSVWKMNSVVTGSGINTGILNNPTGNIYSGYIISGKVISKQQVLTSGIRIPSGTFTGSKYIIGQNQHLMQTTPLKDTFFYKFYNNLYNGTYNSKTIATGTWNGIIPSGTYFSVELISVSLNDTFGITGTNGGVLSAFYSGYGNGDQIDKALISGISPSGALLLYPKNNYINNNLQLQYTAVSSGPSSDDSKFIAKTIANKTINSKIRQLINKVLPNFIRKNRKFRKMEIFKQKLAQPKLQFSKITIPASSEAGSQYSERIIKYPTV